MITIVSGLPRSGTSLTMQMLCAGGFPVFYDINSPNEANPRGYFEWTAGATLWQDTDKKLSAVDGKYVKLFPQVWPALTPDHEYQFIYLDRPMDEIVASHRAMFRRVGNTGEPYAYGLRRTRFQAMSFIQAFRHIVIPHWKLYSQEAPAAYDILEFLKPSASIDTLGLMMACVDPSLRHHQ